MWGKFRQKESDNNPAKKLNPPKTPKPAETKKDCGVIGTCPFCITDPICSLKNALGLGAGATPAPANAPKLGDIKLVDPMGSLSAGLVG
jgi:hypothetical protein